MTDVTEYLTVGSLDEALREVGLTIHDVRSAGPHGPDAPGMYFDATISPGSLESRLILVVTTYAKNENGRRYFGFESREPATETRRFYIGNLGPLVSCTEMSRGELPPTEEL